MTALVCESGRYYRVTAKNKVDLAVVWVAGQTVDTRWHRVRNRRRIRRVLAQARRQVE